MDPDLIGAITVCGGTLAISVAAVVFDPEPLDHKEARQRAAGQRPPTAQPPLTQKQKATLWKTLGVLIAWALFGVWLNRQFGLNGIVLVVATVVIPIFAIVAGYRAWHELTTDKSKKGGQHSGPSPAIQPYVEISPFGDGDYAKRAELQAALNAHNSGFKPKFED